MTEINIIPSGKIFIDNAKEIEFSDILSTDNGLDELLLVYRKHVKSFASLISNKFKLQIDSVMINIDSGVAIITINTSLTDKIKSDIETEFNNYDFDFSELEEQSIATARFEYSNDVSTDGNSDNEIVYRIHYHLEFN